MLAPNRITAWGLDENQGYRPRGMGALAAARCAGRDHGSHRRLRPALRMGGVAAIRIGCAQRPGFIRRGQVEPGICAFQESDSASCASTVSSISMSLNSSESKTSPHSRHSTNSASSWRDTMRTRGCLQTVAMVPVFVRISSRAFPLLQSKCLDSGDCLSRNSFQRGHLKSAFSSTYTQCKAPKSGSAAPAGGLPPTRRKRKQSSLLAPDFTHLPGN